MAFLFPKACESSSFHIASANTGQVHNLVGSCTYANEFFFFLHVLDTGFSGLTDVLIYGFNDIMSSLLQIKPLIIK